jgi:hypothetical protein
MMRSRRAGILLHPTSLPSGTLADAPRWLDFLQAAGGGVWQMLPLGRPLAGRSPYQCASAFAVDPALFPDLISVAIDTLELRAWRAAQGTGSRITRCSWQSRPSSTAPPGPTGQPNYAAMMPRRCVASRPGMRRRSSPWWSSSTRPTVTGRACMRGLQHAVSSCSATCRSSSPTTVPTSGRIRNISCSTTKAIPASSPGCHRIISPPPDSAGAIRTTTGRR